ncbi:MAG TPA: GvpL/GvpF family gas vesicle protein [Terriglobales bacterium]|nr:GvpL/GvpF family gas vesicle protein [Terriglobales bacterium]
MATGLKKRTASHVLYLYGITREGKGTLAGVAGVDGSAAVEALRCGGLVCWVSRVDRAEFAENLARNMENLEWLAEVSVRHQHAVAAISRTRDILPARFGTVFRSEASLTADVEKRKSSLMRDFKRVGGCEEWGVKVFRLEPQPQMAVTAESGRDYLRAKAAALHAQASREGDQEIEHMLEAIKGVAAETTSGGGAVSRGQRGLQWQGALLVKRSQVNKLQQLLRRFSREWEGTRRIEVSGPWPPYSFVSRAQDGKSDGQRGS